MSSEDHSHIKLEPVAHAEDQMPDAKFTLGFLGAGVLVAIITYIVFSLFPTLDQEISRSFYSSESGFLMRHDEFAGGFRKLIIYSITIFYVVVLWCGLKSYNEQQSIWGLMWHKWAFLGFTALGGAVMVVNVILKGNWGRARPKDVNEFGGSVEFTPFWQWANQCQDNCSFTSGEVAGVAVIAITIAFLFESRMRIVTLCIGVIMSALVGWLRVATGSHFTSDAIMSVSLMMIFTSLFYYVFFLKEHNWFERLDELQQKKLDQKKMSSG